MNFSADDSRAEILLNLGFLYVTDKEIYMINEPFNDYFVIADEKNLVCTAKDSYIERNYPPNVNVIIKNSGDVCEYKCCNSAVETGFYIISGGKPMKE